jgi:hypothetical protein
MALVVDWTAAGVPTAALAGSAPGGLVEQVWAPLRDEPTWSPGPGWGVCGAGGY